MGYLELSQKKIQIVVTGLNKGEKLYEELMFDNNPIKTLHPRIMLVKEVSLNKKTYNELINKIPLVKNPPGRYQLICKNNKNIIIDYAHTPEAIREVIYFASQKYKKIVTILGAGGNRDSSKRKLMGNSLKNSNKVIITCFLLAMLFSTK